MEKVLNGQEEASKTIALNIFIKIVGNTLAKSTFASIKYLIQNKKKWSKVAQKSNAAFHQKRVFDYDTVYVCVFVCVCLTGW